MADLINSVGISVCEAVAAYLAAALIAAASFLPYRDWRASKLQDLQAKPLLFHSPDDTPRTFTQAGFVRNWLGTLILHSGVVFFAVGYVYMILFCWFSYAPQFYAPTWPMEAFGGWNGLMAPWLVIFTLIHIVGMSLILSWEALRTRFMIPVERLGDATHIVIEEDLPANTDEQLLDPDAESSPPSARRIASDLKGAAKRLQLKYARATARTILPVIQDADGTKRIEYTCVRYVYSEKEDCFNPTGLVSHTPVEAHKVLRMGGLSSKDAEDSFATCGKNEINVYVPGILESLLREFADFTYVFNSIGTWSYMVYSSWNIGIFWLLLTLGSGIMRSLFIVRPNQKKIRQLAQLHTKCEVLRDGSWTTLEARELVLGDIVAVDDGSQVLPCDGVVIQGSLVVNESMLTGEPMPVQKMPVENSQQASVTKKNIAYAGTSCLQSSGPRNGKAVMIAKAVGALTTRGQLVRMVLFPTSVRFKYNDQLPKVYQIIVVYMLILVAIYSSPLVDLGSWIATYLMVLNTIAMCLSPMLPVSMVMGQSVTARRLEKEHQINCLQPGRIPIAGKISTMVFDKTGTITKDGMDFSSVLPIQEARFCEEVSFDEGDGTAKGDTSSTAESRLPSRMRHAVACCHTVTTLRDGELVGNQVEVSMVRTIGWSIDGDFVTSPCGKDRLEVIKKLDFDHCRMTSGAVVRCTSTGRTEVYVKGSYEKIQSISSPASTPADYDEVTQRFAKEGFYVLGVASKSLPAGLTEQQVADLSRDSLESGLSACGLLLFRNEIKKDSAQAIMELRDGAIRSVICTGDNALTGISVGRQSTVVGPGRVLLADLGAGGRLEWRDPNSLSGEALEPTAEGSSDCQLAVTQAAWRYLQSHPDELEQIWTRIAVFARMKPEDKINVVRYLQSHSLVVGMCGDGGNDCGGLRAAHAGLALSDAEASMVSPFSTGRDGKSLITVVDLIREGRACLATNLATFQYFITYCFVLTGIRTALAVLAGLSMGEYVWVTLDVGIGMVMVWTMTLSRPTARLCDFRPTATLLGPRTVSAIAFPVITSILAMVSAEVLLWSHDWYERLAPITDIHLLPSLWMLRGDNYDSAIGVLVLLTALANTAYVNTYGGSFRRNIIFNYKINIVYGVFLFGLGWLLFSPPTQYNCVFRVNCDTQQSLNARDLSVLAAFSAGGVGGCFLGPQVKVWQSQVMADGWHPDSKTGYKWWLPEKDQDCLPPAGYHTSPLNSTEISQFGCVGPNNCFSQGYKWQLFAVIMTFIILNHVFAKVFLQGCVASTLRRRQRMRDSKLYSGSRMRENEFGQAADTVGQEMFQSASSATDQDLQPYTGEVVPV